jgi:undecaprenyl-diphosphatase
VLALVVSLVTGYLALTRRRGAAVFLIVASLGGLALNTGLKELYGRERPDLLLRLVDADSLSFPSGHAMSSATIYLTLAVLLSKLTTSNREKLYVLSAALFLSFVVGLSRVFLGVHYPSDVIAGWAAGVVWAQICWFAAQFFSRRQLARDNEASSKTTK